MSLFYSNSKLKSLRIGVSFGGLLYYLPTKRVSQRYDLLCIEGISRALRVFLGKDQPPNYKHVHPPGGKKSLLTVTISPEVR